MLNSRTKALMILVLGGAGIVVALRFSPHLVRTPPPEPYVSPPPILAAPEVKTWKDAARRVEEPRGEPVGRAAKVSVPAELEHYGDRRRFLAVQVAEAREQQLDLPADWAGLARMIEDRQLVRVKALGKHHILYGVGGSVTSDALTHYDRATGLDIPLFDGWADFKDADVVLAEGTAKLREQAAEKRQQLRKVSRKQRTKRRALLKEAQSLESQVSAAERRRKRIAYFYEDYDRRGRLVGEYHLLERMAADFGGRRYDLQDPTQRRALKGRLLSYLRPEAHGLMQEVAAAYHQRFGRHLPITSLVRTLRYQRQVGRTNPNATTIEEPPHATGLAFDVHYGRMAAAEQDYMMGVLARLEKDGRLEALRENLNHIHVFVFADGRPPTETLIAGSLESVRPAAPPPAKAKVAVARRAAAPSRSRPAAARRPTPPRSRPRP